MTRVTFDTCRPWCDRDHDRFDGSHGNGEHCYHVIAEAKDWKVSIQQFVGHNGTDYFTDIAEVDLSCNELGATGARAFAAAIIQAAEFIESSDA